jgi:polyphosphate kinase
MERNFFRRVEVAFPIRRQAHREHILRDLGFYLADNCQAWRLQPDGSFERIKRAAGERVVNAQAELLSTYAAGPAAAV